MSLKVQQRHTKDSISTFKRWYFVNMSSYDTKRKQELFFLEGKQHSLHLIKPTTCCLIVCSSTLEHVEAKSCSAGSLLMVLNLRESNRSTSDETNEQWIQNILSFKKLIPSCKVMTLFFSYMWTKLVVQKKRVSMSAKLTGLW